MSVAYMGTFFFLPPLFFDKSILYSFYIFLFATEQLNKSVCRLVGWLVG